MGLIDKILSKAHLFPSKGLLRNYDEDLLLYTLSLFSHPSLISAQLKISGAVRHAGICLVPITLTATAMMSEIREGSHGLRAQTLSSELAHLLWLSTFPMYTSKNTFHRMKRLPWFNDRLALYTANTGDYKGRGFADNLYNPAVILYGKAILVIILALYLALGDECWECIVFLCNGMCNNVLQHRIKLRARCEKCTGVLKTPVSAVILTKNCT